MTPETKNIIKKYISEHGESSLIERLKSSNNNNDNLDVLTIIVNNGIHPIPEKYIHGEVFYATEGNLDFSNKEAIKSCFESCLKQVALKLQQKSWKKVYLVPTGHPNLSLQIKMMIYSILRINSTDLFYSKGDYHELTFEIRDILK